VPRVRRDWTASRLTVLPALGAVQAMKRALPARAARALRRGEIDVLMAYWRLVSPRLARAVCAAGGELYVWTVDDPAHIRRFEALGVGGIVTNEPRLLAPPGAQRSTQRRAL
jgi:glycerophosphoryl diester phosphodiesterase